MKWVGGLAAIFIRLLRLTVRARHVRVENLERVPQYILAFWHDHMLLMLHSRFRKPITVMSSSSRDGDLAVTVYATYGVNAVRGSSTRGGGAALREFIRRARAGSNLVFTPDGPKGPARVAKDGVIFAAQATGLPIVPVAFAASRKKRLGSWDRMIFPLPTSRVIYLYGEPITVPRHADIEEWRRKLEDSMNRLAAEAENNFETLWRKAEG
jgi:lysophospholipid acyltransferase (LPLAT)-like uncharacterized protein